MKCFECGSKCITQYWTEDVLFLGATPTGNARITHVNKGCTNCNWQSFKTKIPRSLN